MLASNQIAPFSLLPNFSPCSFKRRGKVKPKTSLLNLERIKSIPDTILPH